MRLALKLTLLLGLMIGLALAVTAQDGRLNEGDCDYIFTVYNDIVDGENAVVIYKVDELTGGGSQALVVKESETVGAFDTSTIAVNTFAQIAFGKQEGFFITAALTGNDADAICAFYMNTFTNPTVTFTAEQYPDGRTVFNGREF